MCTYHRVVGCCFRQHTLCFFSRVTSHPVSLPAEEGFISFFEVSYFFSFSIK